MTYFDLSKLNLAEANVLKAFESQLQWLRLFGTVNHSISVIS